MNTRLIKNASEFARTLLAMMLCFILSSPTIVVAKTTAGIHCPTAIVQKVIEPTGQMRAPEIGDKEFKQCQCAEKKSGEKKSEIERITTSSVIPATDIPTVKILPLFSRIKLISNFPRLSLIKQTIRATAPPVPPPNSF